MQHRLIPGSIELEHDTPASCPAIESSPIEIACRITDKPSIGVIPVQYPKVVQDSLVPGRVYFERDTDTR
jgi:hypothetical protein